MCVCVCVYVCMVCVFPLCGSLPSCSFSPHQVNRGGVQKSPVQVSLYKSHTNEKSLRRRITDTYPYITLVQSKHSLNPKP